MTLPCKLNTGTQTVQKVYSLENCISSLYGIVYRLMTETRGLDSDYYVVVVFKDLSGVSVKNLSFTRKGNFRFFFIFQHKRFEQTVISPPLLRG